MSLPRKAVAGDANQKERGSQELLIAAMKEPSFYPRGGSEIAHEETHISHVFFVGDLVYKVKKAVRFSFLNYSTLDQRRYFLQEELRLNRRLSPSVYLGILPISNANGRWQLGSDADPVEYVLVMRRLPAKRMLDFLLDHYEATDSMMRTLADHLASFHTTAATGGKIDARGEPEAIERVWNGNLGDLRPFLYGSNDWKRFEELLDFGKRFVASHRHLFKRRIQEGRIRDGHGDLHCEHICFAPEGIQIFDCVEFSPKFRYCDIASEVAFLCMDMEIHGGAQLARVFLERYFERTRDRDMPVLLPFYQSYRALVRAKVNAFRSNAFSPLASRYFDYACEQMAFPGKPYLVLICGLSGTGKSTLARALSCQMGLPMISSDVTRKSLFGAFGGDARAAYEAGVYTPSKTEATYEQMASKAETYLVKKKGVILDATFQRQRQRERMIRLAAQHGAEWLVVFCQTSDAVIRERLRRRERDAQDGSDADWEVYLKQKEAFEPFFELSPECSLQIDTSGSIPDLVEKVERGLIGRFFRRGVGCVASQAGSDRGRPD